MLDPDPDLERYPNIFGYLSSPTRKLYIIARLWLQDVIFILHYTEESKYYNSEKAEISEVSEKSAEFDFSFQNLVDYI